MRPKVIAVNLSAEHSFSKHSTDSINLIFDLGVEGDAHAGKTVKHRFLAKKDRNKRNIRQVHLIQTELLDELTSKSFKVSSGQLGENITTQGIELLDLPTCSRLHIGDQAVIELTALRNPCVQIEDFQKGLLKEVVYKNEQGEIVRRLGVMAIVLVGGIVRPNDNITVELPEQPHHPLEYIW